MPALSATKNASQNNEPTRFPIPAILAEWLAEGDGRAAYFEKVDPMLQGPVISRMKTGHSAVTFEYAIRLERAQKESVRPFRAIDIMTFEEDRALYRYVTGQEPAPPQIKRPRGRKHASLALTAGA